jgi:hypothetical protein
MHEKQGVVPPSQAVRRLPYNKDMEEPKHYDFFVSYNGADQEWAEWVAWVLEENGGYSVKIQAWDIRPGSNFVLEMDQAAKLSARTIVILSPNYLGSNFAQPEWAAAFAGDPKGLEKRIVPVMVEHCEPGGLLGPIAQIRLVGLARDVAADTLLAGVKLGRAKPVQEPAYPGQLESEPVARAAAKAAQSLWTPLSEPVDVAWRNENRRQVSGPTTIELHLIPVTSVLLESRRLAALPDELAALGRTEGLFGTSDGLDVDNSENLVRVTTQRSRYEDDSGIQVTRNGQSGAWTTLPHDGLGSVLDPVDLRERLARLLRLASGAVDTAVDSYAVGISLESVTMLAVGDSSQVGKRSSASMHFFSEESVRIEPDAQVSRVALGDVDSIAEELTARLMARVSRQR